MAAGLFAVPGCAYCTEVTWLIGYVRVSPVGLCSEMADAELLVTVPLKVLPSFNETVGIARTLFLLAKS